MWLQYCYAIYIPIICVYQSVEVCTFIFDIKAILIKLTGDILTSAFTCNNLPMTHTSRLKGKVLKQCDFMVYK